MSATTRLYRIRRVEPDGTVRESRYYRSHAAADARAMRWRGAGWDVDMAVSEPITWSLMWRAGDVARWPR